MTNGAELGGATGAMAPLVFWSRGLKKSRKVSKSKSHTLEWHQLFLPSFGTNDYYTSVGFQIVIKSQKKFLSLIGSNFYKCIFKFHVVCSDQENIQFFGLAQIGWFWPDPILYSKPFFGSFSWHGRGLRTSIPVVFICTRQKQLLDHQLKEEVDGSVR